jgi:hypothetical protein
MALPCKSGLIAFSFFIFSCTLLAFGQISQPTSASNSDQQLSGSISGTIVDRTGAVISGARIQLTRADQSPARETLSGADGQFSFSNVALGSFQLTITSAGFAAQTSSGTLQAGEVHVVPPITLAIAQADTEVQVSLTPTEIAQEEIKDQEKQRVLKVIPNFYVSYVPNAAPLNPKQKFELAWKTLTDPFSFVVIGAVAGVQQAQNNFAGYGQGASGYGKRYGASYGDFLAGTLIGSAILPSILKQDPRYFYKGTGSKRSRLLYALANAVICKGDNGRWQPNYSSILGSLAAGGISNLYYPAEDRNGAKLTFENAAIGIGTTGVFNVLEEFVVRKFVPKTSNQDPAKH